MGMLHLVALLVCASALAVVLAGTLILARRLPQGRPISVLAHARVRGLREVPTALTDEEFSRGIGDSHP